MKTLCAVKSELSFPHSKDGFVSGEYLAEKCGISRQAVWKAVRSLRLRGAKIESVTNRGYRLVGSAGIISEDDVRLLLGKNIDANIIVYETIDSTNTEAKRKCADAFDVHKLNGTVIIAEKQTAGRGRMGRTFYSPKDSGLYLSIIYSPKIFTITPSLLTAVASVGVCYALQDVYGVEARIKWVNDLFLNGKKICGILTEGITNFETGLIECAIVGIGVNILPTNFPKELSAIAGSVLEDKNADTKRSEFAASIITHILSLYKNNDFLNAMIEYRKRSFLIGMKVAIHPVVENACEPYEAFVKGITDDAKLIVQNEDGRECVLESGEVHIGSDAV